MVDKMGSDIQAGRPDQVLLHRFLGVDLELAPGVLVPREETELLGRVAIDLIRAGDENPLVIDMCCGSGNLALAIATHAPAATVWACDLTADTVAVAWNNVLRYELQNRVTVVQGDMFENIRNIGLEGQVDLVMCNPPYISTGRLNGDRAHLLDSEPREAFDGGPYGISIQQRLVREALDFLKPGGWLAFEFGHGQERQAASMITRTKAYSEVLFVLDPNGIPRVAITTKLASPL